MNEPATRTVTVELGPCLWCNAETSLRLPIRRRNVNVYGDTLVTEEWVCEHHLSKLLRSTGGVYEQDA